MPAPFSRKGLSFVLLTNPAALGNSVRSPFHPHFPAAQSHVDALKFNHLCAGALVILSSDYLSSISQLGLLNLFEPYITVLCVEFEIMRVDIMASRHSLPHAPTLAKVVLLVHAAYEGHEIFV